jgi:zinc finger protein
MAFSCDNCGYKTNEVRGGGAISPTGRRMILKVQSKEDFARDVLKAKLLFLVHFCSGTHPLVG